MVMSDSSEDIEKLIAALRADNPAVREAAVRQLGQIGDTRATHALVAMLDDAALFVRWHAVIALREINRAHDISKMIFEPMLKVLAATHQEPIRRVAVFILADIKDKRAVPSLVEAFPHSDNALSLDIFHALLVIGGVRAAERVVPLLDGKSEIVRNVILDRLRAFN